MNIKSIRIINKIIILLLVIYLFAFPPTAYAAESFTLSRLAFCEDGNNYWQEETLYFSHSSQDIPKIILNILFQIQPENTYNFPAGTKAISAVTEGNHLIVNVNENILNYGGSFYESALMAQIIKTALDMEGISKVTLLIENEIAVLAEGGVIKEAESCALMEENLMNFEK